MIGRDWCYAGAKHDNRFLLCEIQGESRILLCEKRRDRHREVVGAYKATPSSMIIRIAALQSSGRVIGHTGGSGGFVTGQQLGRSLRDRLAER